MIPQKRGLRKKNSVCLYTYIYIYISRFFGHKLNVRHSPPNLDPDAEIRSPPFLYNKKSVPFFPFPKQSMGLAYLLPSMVDFDRFSCR